MPGILERYLDFLENKSWYTYEEQKTINKNFRAESRAIIAKIKGIFPGAVDNFNG